MAKKKIEVPAGDDEPVVLSTTPPLLPVIAEKPKFIDLVVFTAKDESLKKIKEKRAEYDLVVINGVEDKENYAVVKAQMEQMRDDRRAFENAAYDNVITPLKTALADYKEAVDAVIDEFKAGEKAEREKKDFIDNEKRRLKLEAEEAKERAALLRINSINVLGAQFNGSIYTFEYDDSLLINTLQLKDFDDAEFDEFLAEVQLAYNTEQKRIDDAKLKEEQEAEEQRQLAAKNKADNEALAEKRTKLRLKEFKLLGAVESVPDLFSFPTIGYEGTVTLELLKIAEDAEWDELIYDLENFTPAVDPLVKELVETDFIPEGGDFIEDSPAILDEIQSGGGVIENIPMDDDDSGLPLSTFYLAEVIDYESKDIADEETFKEWAAEALIDDVRENTPHAEQGDEENTMCFKWAGKFFEVTITNISWNRYDKQYYFIEMFSAPNLIIKEVKIPSGTRPVYKVATSLIFTQQAPYTDCDISKTMFTRYYPNEYAESALAGIEFVANQGKLQELNWVIIKRQ